MGQYILRRLLQAIPLIIIITVIVFFLLKAAGDPLAELALDPRITESDKLLLRAQYGLDDPLPMQFVHWLIGDDWYTRELELPVSDTTIVAPNTCYGVEIPEGERVTVALSDGREQTTLVKDGQCYRVFFQQNNNQGILRGDFGMSIARGRPVIDVIGEALPNTLLLGISSYLVIVVVAFSLGIFQAIRQYSIFDNIITTFSFILVSMPIFLVALLAVYIFAVQFRKWGLPYLPVQGMYSVNTDYSIGDLIRHMILPVFCLAAISIAGYSRFVRASMLEVINSDYVRTARAKGLGERRITYVHALKNASLPLVTLMALDIPFILAGAVVTEQIFSWPGMGTLYIQSLNRLDYAVVITFVLMLAIAVVLFQLIADVLYAVLDPRVRYS
ncbi:MAG: ABC transporter permease [Phototrophicales bacterium]|nr:ABC transporter permease [Phototrophicales bacterium]